MKPKESPLINFFEEFSTEALLKTYSLNKDIQINEYIENAVKNVASERRQDAIKIRLSLDKFKHIE